MVDVRVRRPVSGDGSDIARAHIQAWKIGYATILPSRFLAELDEAERGEAWEQRLLAHERRPELSHEFLVAELCDQADQVDRLVGVITLGAERGDGGNLEDGDSVGEIWMINVLPSAWGCGVGSRLLTSAQSRLTEIGFDEAVLWVLTANDRARRFYERHGWSPDGGYKTETFGGREVEELRYRRSL